MHRFDPNFSDDVEGRDLLLGVTILVAGSIASHELW
jgi:hypothetical protein